MYWMLLPPNANVGRAYVEPCDSLFIAWRDSVVIAWTRFRGRLIAKVG